jgi:hypothetical protein
MLKFECPCCGVLFNQDEAKSYKVNGRRPKARPWPPVHQDQEDITTTEVDSYPQLND